MDASRAALDFLGTHLKELEIGLGLFLISFVGSLAIVTFVLTRLPEDYLDAPEDAPFWPDRPAWMRIAARIGKNLLGVLLVATGVVLSLPGVPGQGALTMVIGIMLLDVPGKRRIERRILGQPKVFAAVNRLRARFHKPPLRHHERAAAAP